MTEEVKKEYSILCASRKQVRRLATNSHASVMELFKMDKRGKVTEIPSEDEFDAKFIIAADRFDRLFQVDSQVSELIFQLNLTERELDADFDSTAEYRDKWLDLNQRKLKLYKVEPPPSENGSQNTVLTKKSRSLKLFKLEPKKYDGSLQGWIGFWAMFRTIHEDKDLDPEEKFLYLLQLTKEGSPARELLDSFPPSAQNYPKAIETLTNRFGRTDMLIELYVRELLKLVLVQATGSAKLSLSSLYDRLETQLRALESLGVVKDNFSNMLLPLVESSLPDTVLRHWERERTSKAFQEDTPGFQGRLDELLMFLRKEVESEERLALARGTFSAADSPNVSHPKTKSIKKDSSKENSTTSTPTAAGLVNLKASPNEKVSCIFCSNTHASENCLKAHDLSSDDIKQKIQQNGHCFLCFRKGHSRNRCKAFVKCVICGSKHNPLLCPERKLNSKLPCSELIEVDNNMSATNYSPVLLQTLKVKLRGDNGTCARVLIDCGSQRSYATRRIVDLVGYKPHRQETLVHALFGGSSSTPQVHHCYKIRLSSLSDNYHCNFDVLDTQTICQAIPGPPHGPWLCELKQRGIQLSDQGEGPVDVLIGADVAGKLWTGRRIVLKCGLVAMETVLGWTLMGKLTDTESNYQSNISMLCTDATATDLWRVDILGIEDPVEKSSRHQRDLAAKEHFLKTVKVLDDGRYEVQLPWVEDHAPLPINFEIATKRLESTVRKLQSTGCVEDYDNVFCEWLQDGVIEKVPFCEWKAGHYLPHRPVIKEGSTTRIRPVFDASCRTKGFPSLNQCLETGMNLIEQIPSILLRFRVNKIGIIADIKKAILQLSVAPTDRDFLRFLWIKEDGNTQIFRHKRVDFGVSNGPFLLEVAAVGSIDRIEWRLNPPSAPWWGGFWERIVGIMKVRLKKILGRASLSLDELTTVVCECAAFINSRPITYVSDTPSDPEPITPQMFLSDLREMGVPDFEHIDSSSVERRFQWRNETKQNLHLRFRTEYLGQLKLSTNSFKKTRKPMVGELVLVGSDNKKRIDWPLAIVEELIEGPDGNCRVVKLRTTDGILTRAIQKIYPLEIPLAEDSGDVQDSDEVEEVNSDGPDDDVQPNLEDGPSEVQVKTSDSSLPKKIVREVKTRCGRKVKLPVKFCD